MRALFISLLCCLEKGRYLRQSGGYNHVPQIHENYGEICIYWAIYYPFKNSYISSRVSLSSRNRNRLLGESETVIVVISVANLGVMIMSETT